MKIDYFGRHHEELSAAQRRKLERKLSKIQRILTRREGLEAHVTVSRERHHYEVELTLRALRHTLVVSGTGSTSFVAMNAALDKLEKQAVRNKHKLIDTTRPRRQRDSFSPVVADTLRDTASTGSGERPGLRIVHTAAHEAKLMTAEEAQIELENGDRDFVSYRDADTGRTNVLLRRDDGSAELVEAG